MLRASLRGLLQRKLRLGLAMFAIVLSVAFLSAAFVLTDTFQAKLTSLFQTVNANVDVQVAPGKDADSGQPPRLTQADLDRIAAVQGVERVSGDISAQGVLPFSRETGKALRPSGPALGAGIPPDATDFSLVTLDTGRMPSGSGEVALSRFTAAEAGVAVGDTVKIFIPLEHAARDFTVVGLLVYPGDRGTLAGELISVFEPAEAQRMFFGEAGRFAGANVAAEDGVSHTDLDQRISAVLPAGFEARTSEEATAESTAASDDALDTFRIFFLVFVGVAALVGAFLIYNTFNIVVAQRTRELALFRALGASWPQVTGSVLAEAFIVGLVGATVGLGAGIGLGVAALYGLTDLLALQLPEGGLTVSAVAIASSYALGVIVTLLSAFVPAIRASGVPPIAAMRDVLRPDKPLRTISIVGTAIAVPGAALVGLALRGIGGATLPVLGLGVVLVFFGVALLSPALARPLGGPLGRLLAWGPAGQLGRRNALRNPRRTAVTAAALMIGVTLVTSVSVLAASFKTSITESLRTDLSADLMVNTQPTSQPDGREGFDPKRLDDVRAIPNVEAAVAFYVSGATIDGQPNFVLAADVAQVTPIIHMKATSGELRTLRAGELVVDSGTAKTSGWQVGDTVRIALARNGVKDYTVVGIYKATPVNSGIVLGLPALDDFAGQLAYQGAIDVSEGADLAAVQAQVERVFADEPLVMVVNQAGMADQVNTVLDIVQFVFLGLLGLALFIALLGILNTLLLSIVERTRELGLVRAVGLGRGGLMRMVTVESIVIAVFGCVLGILLGLGLGAAATQALIGRELITTLALPWGSLAGYFIGATLAGVIAAIWPAWRASRLNVLEAISYE